MLRFGLNESFPYSIRSFYVVQMVQKLRPFPIIGNIATVLGYIELTLCAYIVPYVKSTLRRMISINCNIASSLEIVGQESSYTEYLSYRRCYYQHRPNDALYSILYINANFIPRCFRNNSML